MSERIPGAPLAALTATFAVLYSALRRDAHYRALALRREHTTHDWSVAARYGEPKVYTFPVYVVRAAWRGNKLVMGTE